MDIESDLSNYRLKVFNTIKNNNNNNIILKDFDFNKYNIISNNIIFDTPENILYKIELFLENFINNNNILVIPDYINQIVYFTNNLNDIILLIYERLKNYIVSIKNNLRLLIKKNNFCLIKFIELLKNIYNKCILLNNIVPNNNKILINYLELINEYILFDSIIYYKIESYIIELDFKYQSNINKLITFIKKVSIIDTFSLYNKLNKYIEISFKNFLLKNNNKYNNIIPLNIRNIYILNNNINYLSKIKKYLYLINNEYIYELILEYFCVILNNNSVYEIELVINNTNKILYKIINNYKINTDNTIIKHIYDSVLLLIDQIDDENIISMINIIKFINNINKYELDNIYYKLSNITIKQKLFDININNNIIDKIIIYLNDLIIIKNIDEIKEIINIISFFKNTDLIIKQYYELLIKRLLSIYINSSDIKNDILFENIISDYLKIKFKDVYIYKISKILSDILYSNVINNNFNNDNINYINNNILITSYESWNLNQSNSTLCSDIINNLSKYSLFTQYLVDFDNNYKNNNNKILNFILDYGEINITFNDQIIIMLPIQFIILELVNDNKLSYDDIYNNNIFKNYNKYNKKNIIDSMLLSGILIKETNIIKLSDNKINNTNLIEIFTNLSNNINLFEEKNLIKLCHNRNTIICTNINSILKINNYTYLELYDKIKNNINIFELTFELFDKSLKYMIDNDYIINNNNIYEKIYY